MPFVVAAVSAVVGAAVIGLRRRALTQEAEELAEAATQDSPAVPSETAAQPAATG